MEGGDAKGSVCVTGGTGYVASWLIMKLLEHGYRVRTTVRSYNPGFSGRRSSRRSRFLRSRSLAQICFIRFSSSNPQICFIRSQIYISDSKKDLSYLTDLPGASEKLQIFNADLARPDSFDEAIQGCIGVFHVAHPMDFEDKEPEEVKTQRAINATLGILKSCLKSKTIKRVIYTSSASTIMFNEKGLDVLDESHWSDVDFIRSLNPYGASYMISKTLTEKAALEFAEKHGLDLITVIPTLTNGPFICPRVPSSVDTAMVMMHGKKDKYSSLAKLQMVHIDDVASAHIFLFEYPDAKGRYLCLAVDLTIYKLFEFLSAKYPECPTPDSFKEIECTSRSNLSSKKLLDTGFKYKYGLEEMYDGAIQCCKEKGFL